MPIMVLVHGTCIDLAGVAVLLRGPAGSGKSDLALRLIDQGARLIADDQVEVERAEDALVARAPQDPDQQDSTGGRPDGEEETNG